MNPAVITLFKVLRVISLALIRDYNAIRGLLCLSSKDCWMMTTPNKEQKLKSTINTHGYLNLEMGEKMIEQESTGTVQVLVVLIGQDERYKDYLVNRKNSMMKFLNTWHSMVKRSAKYADLKTRKAIAEGPILSKISYCISLWGTTTAGIMQQLQVLQNDVVRTVFGVGRRKFQEKSSRSSNGWS